MRSYFRTAVAFVMTVVMMLVVTHDYLVGQQDIGTGVTAWVWDHHTDEVQEHSSGSVHHHFHAPALTVSEPSLPADNNSQSLEYALQNLHPFQFCGKRVPPPKTLL